jgi:hypothetical protein
MTGYLLPPATPTPAPAPTSPAEGAELLRKLQISLARTRSVDIEASGDIVTALLSPEVMPDSLLNGVLQHLDGKTPTWGTVNNILYLARSEPVRLGYFLHWGEDLPERHSFPMYAGGDT